MRKRDRLIPAWYCGCGLPKGHEGHVFAGQGLVPIQIAERRRHCVQLAGYVPHEGHADDGHMYLWVVPMLAALLTSALIDLEREQVCSAIGRLPTAERQNRLIEFDAAMRLGGVDAAIAAVLP